MFWYDGVLYVVWDEFLWVVGVCDMFGWCLDCMIRIVCWCWRWLVWCCCWVVLVVFWLDWCVVGWMVRFNLCLCWLRGVGLLNCLNRFCGMNLVYMCKVFWCWWLCWCLCCWDIEVCLSCWYIVGFWWCRLLRWWWLWCRCWLVLVMCYWILCWCWDRLMVVSLVCVCLILMVVGVWVVIGNR